MEKYPQFPVTHRLHCNAPCDQIFVMDQGRIVERGTHLKLLNAGGAYAQKLRTLLAADQAEEIDDAASASKIVPDSRLHLNAT